MSFDFPTSPTVDEEYTAGAMTWVWDGAVWNIKPPDYQSSIEHQLRNKVDKAGDSMSGKLTLSYGPPEYPGHAANKSYVDAHPPGEAPEDNKQYGRENGEWTEVIGGIGDAPLEPIGVVYGRSMGRWQPIDFDATGGTGGGGGLKWVNAAGDQMRGPLYAHTDQPIDLLEMVPKQYVDNQTLVQQEQLERKVNIGGDQMQGPLLLDGNATEPMQAVTYEQLDALKYYVDNASSVEAGEGLQKDGIVLSLKQPEGYDLGGVALIARSPLNGLELDRTNGILTAPPANDIQIGSITEPTADGQQYARVYDGTSGSWQRLSGVITSDLPPADPPPNALWFNSSNGDLNIWYTDLDSSQWVQVSAGGNGGEFLPLAGGTLTGPLTLPSNPPTDTAHATHKAYVDSAISAKSLYQSIWQVAADTPPLDPAIALPLHGYSWVAATVDPMVPETAPAGLPGIGGTLIGTNDNIVWNANTNEYEHLKSTTSGSAYLPLSGGTLTGILNMQTGHPAMTFRQQPSNNSVMTLSPSAEPHSGLLEFFDPANGTTRRGYIGFGDDTELFMRAENNCRWNINNAYLSSDVTVAANLQFTADGASLDFRCATSGTICWYSGGGGLRYRIAVEDQHFYINAGGTGNCIDITRNGNVNLPLSNLSVSGRITINANQHFTVTNDGYGIAFAGGTLVYKKSGGGGILREATGNTRWGIENNAGVWQGYISKQSTRDVGTVEELITNAVTPLLDRIAALEVVIAELRGAR
jgi:hypothetical protein